ncbi:hypothetical protein GCM10023192_16690 [Amycolatopsis samaneae]
MSNYADEAAPGDGLLAEVSLRARGEAPGVRRAPARYYTCHHRGRAAAMTAITVRAPMARWGCRSNRFTMLLVQRERECPCR